MSIVNFRTITKEMSQMYNVKYLKENYKIKILSKSKIKEE